MKKAIQLDEKDNIATVTSDIEVGEIVEVLSPDGKDIGRPKLLDPIQFGHKLAMVDFEKGDRVIKYGEVIGVATKAIMVGEWVHVHNVESTTVPMSAYKGE